MNLKTKANILLFATAMLWGMGFVGSDYLLSLGFTPIESNFLRFLIASICLIAIFYKKLRLINKKILSDGFIIGLFLFLGFSFQTIGLKYTTITNNAFITSTNIIWVGLISIYLFKVKLARTNIIGIIITIIGLYFLTTAGSGLSQISMGDILTLICALLFAFHICAVFKYGQRNDPALMAMLQIIVAAILSFILLIFLNLFNLEEATNINVENPLLSILALLFMGIFPTTLAFLMQQTAQKNTTSSQASIILSTEAIFGSLFAVLLRGESLSLIQIFGIILIVFAVILVETKFSFLFKKTVL